MTDVVIISGGVVQNVICADDVARAQEFNPDCLCVERPEGQAIGPGWLFDGASFSPPPAPPPQPISFLQFLQLFTSTQRINIRASTDPAIRDAMDMMGRADSVDFADPDTVQFISRLASLGFISAGDAQRIIS